jgi:hypothetical protein
VHLTQLVERMDAEVFPVNDKLLRTASEAEDRLQHLLTFIHYLGGERKRLGGNEKAPVQHRMIAVSIAARH